VGDKKAAEAVASTIRAKLQLGEFGFEEQKPVPAFKEYADKWININVPAMIGGRLVNWEIVIDWILAGKKVIVGNEMRPLKKAPFCPIPVPAPWNAQTIPLVSGSNFNPPPNFGGLILEILNVFLPAPPAPPAP